MDLTLHHADFRAEKVEASLGTIATGTVASSDAVVGIRLHKLMLTYRVL